MEHKAKSLLTTLLAALIIMALLPTTAFAASNKKVPAKVSISKVTASTNSVTVKWKKAKNATSYRIYYKRSGAKKWITVANVSSSKTRYTHKSSKKTPLVKGKKYVYTVRAYNKKSKKWGKYNTKGVSVTIPKKTSTPAKVLVQSVDIDSVTTAIESKGGTYQFTSKVLPANATNKTLKWTSSNPKVATVDQNGKVTGISEGTVTITATATDGSGKKDTAPIKVDFHIDHTKIPATGIKISKTSAELSGWRDSTPIEATLTPSNTTDWVEWDSSNSDVAYVNNGKISAGYPGTATLTAYVANNPSIKATCTVTVDYVQSVCIGDSSIDLTSIGDTYQLSASLSPSNTKHNALSWSSDDTSVVTVDQNGKVTAMGYGTATIYCKATDTKQPNNPDLTSSCSVTVKIPDYYRITFDKNDGSGSSLNLVFKPGTKYSTSQDTETRDGYDFAGWYTEPTGGQLVTSFILEKDIVLYAHWTKNETGIPGTNLYLEGADSTILSVWAEDYTTPVDLTKVTFEYDNSRDIFSDIPSGRTGEWTGIAIKAHRQGTVTVLAKYNGQILKRWTVNVTSNWSDYVGYVNWRRGVENQIWNSDMSVIQKLDAAKDYIKTNFKYGTEVQPDGYKAYAAVYAWQEGYHFVDCITSSEFMGDFAKDLGLKVYYVNAALGKRFDYLVNAYSASDGHILNEIVVGDQLLVYDAQPPH